MQFLCDKLLFLHLSFATYSLFQKVEIDMPGCNRVMFFIRKKEYRAFLPEEIFVCL